MTEAVFVFGSNLAGRHGKGAALWARQHRGAIYGQGIGLQGNSYAIPSKILSCARSRWRSSGSTSASSSHSRVPGPNSRSS
jgi:hypothetical protein